MHAIQGAVVVEKSLHEGIQTAATLCSIFAGAGHCRPMHCAALVLC